MASGVSFLHTVISGFNFAEEIRVNSIISLKDFVFMFKLQFK